MLTHNFSQIRWCVCTWDIGIVSDRSGNGLHSQVFGLPKSCNEQGCACIDLLSVGILSCVFAPLEMKVLRKRRKKDELYMKDPRKKFTFGIPFYDLKNVES